MWMRVFFLLTKLKKMANRPTKGKWIVKSVPKTASVTFTANDLVQMTSGYVATATAKTTEIMGMILTAVTSGDSDFASATNLYSPILLRIGEYVLIVV